MNPNKLSSVRIIKSVAKIGGMADAIKVKIERIKDDALRQTILRDLSVIISANYEIEELAKSRMLEK